MTSTDSVAQKSAAIEMAEIVKSEIPEMEYGEFRRRGLEAKVMKCANEAEALSELAQLTSEKVATEPVVLDESNVGRTLSEVMSSKARIRALVENSLAEGRRLDVDTARISTMGAAYLRLLILSANLGKKSWLDAQSGMEAQ